MSLVDYSDLEQEITDAEEPKTLPKGTEVKARIITVRSGISEKGDYNGCTWFSVVFDVPDNPMAMEFSDFFWELNKDLLPAKTYAREIYKMQQFAVSFSVDLSRPFSWEDDLPSKEGWLIVGTKTSDDYGLQNTVSKYVAGR